MAGEGKEASFDSAQFIFSQDAACTDTQRYKLHVFCQLLNFFIQKNQQINLFNDSFRNYLNTIRVSNSLDPDQARHFVGPELSSN